MAYTKTYYWYVGVHLRREECCPLSILFLTPKGTGPAYEWDLGPPGPHAKFSSYRAAADMIPVIENLVMHADREIEAVIIQRAW